jgi:hypothetical protein
MLPETVERAMSWTMYVTLSSLRYNLTIKTVYKNLAFKLFPYIINAMSVMS